MKRAILLLTSLMIACVLSAQESFIVPRPSNVVEDFGTFQLSRKTVIYIADNALRTTTSLFVDDMARALGGKMPITQIPRSKNSIAVYLYGKLAEEEYKITIASSGVVITGGSARAISYAFQTMRQMIINGEMDGKTVVMKCQTIQDKPFFKYRGGHLDVGRHFFTVDEVKRFIDILALHKANHFHFHLTEDQGWRIEIKQYPRLTEIGSVRAATQVGNDRTKLDGVPYKGFYTQEQIRDIVNYARQRYIDIIPEIEMPGHSVAALASYPELGCTGGPYEVRQTWGISDQVFCAGKESTFTFIENVLSEVISLFPYKYIHIGGDECPKKAWQVCQACQQRIKDEGLKDEHELQSYFVKRIEKWLNDRGRSIIGWDEILEGGVSHSATVMSWRGKKGGIAAAKMGNKVIMAPNTNCYLDYYQTSDPIANNEPLAIGKTTRFLNVDKVYSLDPYEGLSDDEKGCILGVQANMWGEYVATFDHIQHMFLPRFAAVAEVGWSYDRKDIGDFSNRLKEMKNVYDYFGFKYAPYFFNGIK